MLLVSLVLAGVAAVSANRWMTNRLAAAGGELSGVVAAAVEIPFGTKIDATLIKVVELPPKAMPATAFRDPQVVIGPRHDLHAETTHPQIERGGQIRHTQQGIGIRIRSKLGCHRRRTPDQSLIRSKYRR